jgi:hypothetical protein
VCGFAFEVKRAASVTPTKVDKWWQQAVHQTERTGLRPSRAHRQDRQPWSIRLPLVAPRSGFPEDLTVDLEIRSFCSLIRALPTTNSHATGKRPRSSSDRKCTRSRGSVWLAHLAHRGIVQPAPLLHSDRESMGERGKVTHHGCRRPLPPPGRGAARELVQVLYTVDLTVGQTETSRRGRIAVFPGKKWTG